MSNIQDVIQLNVSSFPIFKDDHRYPSLRTIFVSGGISRVSGSSRSHSSCLPGPRPNMDYDNG